jgi:hypothetical protein
MDRSLVIRVDLDHSQEGSYLTRPFPVPAHTESLRLVLRYEREVATTEGGFTSRRRSSNIDLGLLSPDGRQAGYSGSERTEVLVSETEATPGYTPQPIAPGEWRVLLGAHRVAPGGVRVTCEITLSPKRARLLKGDLHCHTVASDGVHTVEELGAKALRHGLQFLAVTDHNLVSSRESFPRIPGLTLIPGVEWTHYSGHANVLGVEDPWDEPFFEEGPGGVRGRFDRARERGALVTVNHPFEPGCEFQPGLDSVPFDCLEVWNGPMRESNLRAVGLWQALLQAGRKVPACGGSDYHRDTPFIFLGGPTVCAWSLSAGAGDILDALRRGHACLSFAPGGPVVDLRAGDAGMGDSVRWSACRELCVRAAGLAGGDVVRVVTGTGAVVLCTAPENGDLETTWVMEGPGFARVEILRAFLPGVPLVPAALSNPVYFDRG